jgi:transcriptional regulator with PAS, ATPase and Fis domain
MTKDLHRHCDCRNYAPVDVVKSITAEHLCVLLRGGVAQQIGVCAEEGELHTIIEAAERRAIAAALARCNNNRSQAAKTLGITRPLLYKKMHAYGMH